MYEHAYVGLFVSLCAWETARMEYMDMCRRIWACALMCVVFGAGFLGNAIYFTGMWVELCECVSACTKEGA